MKSKFDDDTICRQHARQSRRVTSLEARVWASRLRLRRPAGKLVLVMLAAYIDADCISRIRQKSLAYDCEFTLETILQELTWLDRIGAIVRLSQGSGRRGSDKIELQLFADTARIAELAALSESERAAYLQSAKSELNDC